MSQSNPLYFWPSYASIPLPIVMPPQVVKMEFQLKKATEGFELKITLVGSNKKLNTVPISKVGDSWYFYLTRHEFLQLRGEIMKND